MSQEVLVSVLIPCFNAGRFIGEAIESALCQTYRNVEVVVVDDGSEDDSVDVVRSFGARVTLVVTEHAGGCAARNRALSICHGSVVQYLDADDKIIPTKLEKMLPPIVAGQADLVVCRTLLFQEGVDPWGESLRPSPVGIDPMVYLMKFNPGTNNPLHRRSCLEAVGGFRASLPAAQEWDLHVRLGAIGVRIAEVPEDLVLVRLHDGPKVSSTPRGPAFMLELLIKLSFELEAEGLLTEERRLALAERILLFSTYAVRGGALSIAQEGFDRSEELASVSVSTGGGLMRLAARVVGVRRAELLRYRLIEAWSVGWRRPR